MNRSDNLALQQAATDRHRDEAVKPLVTLPVLYVIPTPLGICRSISPEIAAVVSVLTDYVAESAKQARAFLKTYPLPEPIQAIRIAELNEHTRGDRIGDLMTPLREGRSLGLVSDAGCPGIADPGSTLVRLAHQQGFRVHPLVGPCSITLALMASGLDGQRHQFHGYLPTHDAERLTALRRLEKASRATQTTMIFIETPYRNDRLLDAMLRACRPDTLLCIASNLTQPDERIVMQPLEQWRKRAADCRKQPSVFLLRASG